MAHYELQVFGDLHVVNLEVNWILCNVLASPARVAQDREGFHSDGVPSLQCLDDIEGVSTTGKRN